MSVGSRKKRVAWIVCALLSFSMLLVSCKKDEVKYQDWSDYLGGPDRNHFSNLSQINPENVSNLQLAWSYAAPDSGQMQMSPVIYQNKLFGVTAGTQAFALNAATGKQIWIFGEPLRQWFGTSRGVALWKGKNEARVFFSSGTWLWCLNAENGQPIESFGEKGKIDLHSGLPESAKDKFISSSTPGTIFEDLIILSIRTSEGEDAVPGDVRAFNVHTGKLVWSFHTIPHPGEPGYETWENPDAWQNGDTGAANNWSGMSVDVETGTLFVPTGSAAPDFYGGRRLGSNLYANSLIALNARTGEHIWHYQFIHHDLWDRDAPTPPNLITVTRNGKKVKAVTQLTKQGYIFVFDRTTGEPLFDIEEKTFPNSTLEGEKIWPTQPIPVKPAPFARQSDQLTESDISPYATNREELLQLFRASDRRLFAPPAITPVFLLPGYDGGAEWGGTGADPDAGIIYVNSNEMAWILQMEPSVGSAALSKGASVYSARCVTCHQSDRKGIPAGGFPSLIDIGKRKSRTQIDQIITLGKGMMTGFPQLKPDEKSALIEFLLGTEKLEIGGGSKMSNQAPRFPYQHTGYNKFLDVNGLPGISPPWGTLNAIDLNTGEYLWKITYGETLSLKEKGYPQTGSESYGGPVITGNGLLFIAGTKDGLFRAYNRHSGVKLWETALPAAAYATPATYMVNGRQFVALACGGEKLGAPKGNQIVAFALPE